ncbi:MAG TPA: DPP IV N-terminal domain-containing protein [Rhodanobacteraceae bacterium]
MKPNRIAVVALVALLGTAPLAASARQLTDADYQQAVKMLAQNTFKLVDHDVQHVNWLDGTHFWYVDHDAQGDRVLEMDAATGKIAPAFDAAKLAAALSKATGKPVSATKWPMFGFSFHPLPDGRLAVQFHGGRYICDLAAAGTCSDAPKLEGVPRSALDPANGALSPNGELVAYVHDWNLWVSNVETGKATQLTFDGVKNYGYATQNAGWVHTDNGAIVRWSPNSQMIATYRQDQRKVGDMYTIRIRVGHPTLHQWKYALPGDKHVFMIEPVIVNVATKKIVPLKMDPEQRLSTSCDTLACDAGEREAYKWSDVQWAPDSRTLALVTTSRNRQHEWFRIANAETGAVRTGFHWTAKDYYTSGLHWVNWRYLADTDQAIWPTVQNNWLNLYLYDLKTGKRIRPITTGKGNVDHVVRIDRATHTLWFVGNDRTPGVNPYYKQFFKVDMQTGKTTLLTPEDADHTITMSPNGQYFVDSYSTQTTPPVTVLRAADDGHVIATVAKASIARLKAAGWVPPVPFTVKARDGKTTLYGLMFKPANFNPQEKYPLVDYIYPGPQTGSIFSFSFMPSVGDNQALANLGFIVIQLNGMGTPWRSASFQRYWYGDMGDDTLPDQVAGIKELAKRYPWIDVNRVGIWGHSGGGNATAMALFKYPDFFKVGWAESGNYDNRNYENDWGEKYQGLLVKNKNGTTNYDNQAAQLFAKNLKGHLMLVDGAIDDNVPHSNTFLLVNALMNANKNFSMLFLPNEHHGYGADSPYVMRRRWDWFVKYLAGNTPPHEFKMPKPDFGG